MGATQDRLGQVLLRFASPLTGLRRVPVLGQCVSWVGTKLVPRNSLTWAQVQGGPAKGLWLHLNPRTGASYFEGGGEPEVQQVLRQELRPGMTFYDVGANIGLFSMIAARLVGERGHVVAFEADPEIAARLREHIQRNEFLWARVEEKAVWSEAKNVYFARIDPEVSPDRGLGHVVGSEAGGTIEVKAVSLDEYTQANALPDFIKCDVEGGEVEVFRGAQRLLSQRRPGIVCEMHSEENRRTLLTEFEKIGYRCRTIGTNHVVALSQ